MLMSVTRTHQDNIIQIIFTHKQKSDWDWLLLALGIITYLIEIRNTQHPFNGDEVYELFIQLFTKSSLPFSLKVLKMQGQPMTMGSAIESRKTVVFYF